MAKPLKKELKETVSRGAILETILSSNNFKREKMDLFGATIEIRQPSVKELLSLDDVEDQKARIVHLLINHAFMPGTNEKVFDKAHFDSIMEMPGGMWIRDLTEKFGILAGLDQDVSEKNLEETTLDS